MRWPKPKWSGIITPKSLQDRFGMIPWSRQTRTALLWIRSGPLREREVGPKTEMAGLEISAENIYSSVFSQGSLIGTVIIQASQTSEMVEKNRSLGL